MSLTAPTYSCRRFLRLMRNRKEMGDGRPERNCLPITIGSDRKGSLSPISHLPSGLGLLLKLVLLTSVFATGTNAQGPAPNDRLLIRATPSSNITRAVRIEQAPVLDGRDDDGVWRSAPRIEDFIQMSPTEAGPPLFPTSVRVVY